MSHFCVIVTGDNVEAALAPFNENLDHDSRAPAEFRDTENDCLAKYNNDRDTSGVPYRSKFDTFEQFMAHYFGMTARDPETNRYGYWFNPMAKWDWWVVGGRWSGYFTLRPGAEGTIGEPGVFGNEAEPGTADSCLKRDVDVEEMMSAAAKEAAKSYDTYAAAIAGCLPARTWKQSLEMFSGNLDEARAYYNAQPAKIALNKAGIFTLECAFEVFGGDKDAYVEKARMSALSPFAVLHNGVWSERGEMGWFGSCSNEKPYDAWEQEFQAFWKSLPPDTRVTLVDCHI